MLIFTGIMQTVNKRREKSKLRGEGGAGGRFNRSLVDALPFSCESYIRALFAMRSRTTPFIGIMLLLLCQIEKILFHNLFSCAFLTRNPNQRVLVLKSYIIECRDSLLPMHKRRKIH